MNRFRFSPFRLRIKWNSRHSFPPNSTVKSSAAGARCRTVPEGKHDWKPHDKSMIFGYLTEHGRDHPDLDHDDRQQDELDIAPKGGPQHRPEPMNTSEEFLAALDKSAADARAALGKTNDEHLQTPWKLLAGGNVVQEQPRYEMIQDTINHWAHHRGQMTVYLRLMGARCRPSTALRRRQALLAAVPAGRSRRSPGGCASCAGASHSQTISASVRSPRS